MEPPLYKGELGQIIGHHECTYDILLCTPRESLFNGILITMAVTLLMLVLYINIVFFKGGRASNILLYYSCYIISNSCYSTLAKV